MSNGTLYILSDQERSEWPEIRMMTSTGLAAENSPENIAMREPTANNMDFLGPYQAFNRWPGGIWGVSGSTVRAHPGFVSQY
jgi:hypothetical protein